MGDTRTSSRSPGGAVLAFAAVAAAMAILPGCGYWKKLTPDPVERAAARARREYEVLAVSLSETAKAWVDELHGWGAQLKGKPSVGLDVVDDTRDENRVLVTREASASPPEGPEPARPEVCWLRGRIYRLRATEEIRQYKYLRIKEIARSRSLRPLSYRGTVEIEVTKLTRQSESRAVPLPPSIPKGYRRLTDKEKKQVQEAQQRAAAPPSVMSTRGEPKPELYEVSAAPQHLQSFLPWRLVLDVRRLPEPVRPLVEQVSTECLTADQKKSTEVWTLTFEYSVADRDWVLKK